MKRLFKYAALAIGLLVAVIVGSGAKGYWDALSDAEKHRQRANDRIAQGFDGASLGAAHLAVLLKVEDPNFVKHSGVDFSTPGAGLTTISQSLAKRLAFESFSPGFGKIRQTGYALGLERRLSKDQILALWLDTLEMGRGPDGWMIGFHNASAKIYQRPPAELNAREFARLVAVLIAPASYNLAGDDAALDERVRRIDRLVVGKCAPSGLTDVWLDGCGQADR